MKSIEGSINNYFNFDLFYNQKYSSHLFHNHQMILCWHFENNSIDVFGPLRACTLEVDQKRLTFEKSKCKKELIEMKWFHHCIKNNTFHYLLYLPGFDCMPLHLVAVFASGVHQAPPVFFSLFLACSLLLVFLPQPLWFSSFRVANFKMRNNRKY